MRPGLALLLLLASSAPFVGPSWAHAEHEHGTDGVLTIGVDAAEDVRPFVPEDEPGPTVRPEGADLRRLEARVDDENLTLRLSIDRLPDPHVPVVYTVFFQIGDAKHYVCWDPHLTEDEVVAEDIDGVRGLCGRVGHGTRLGPTTTGSHPGADALAGGRAGVVVETTGLGTAARTSIAWNLTSVDLPEGVPRFITEIRAVSWTLGPPAAATRNDVDRAPFVVADRAPDSGEWTADLAVLERPKAIPGMPRLTLTPVGSIGDRAVADRGGNVTFRVRIVTHDIAPWMGNQSYIVRLLDAPDGIEATHAPADFTLRYKAAEVEVRTKLVIGPNVTYETSGYAFWFLACNTAVEAPESEDDPLPPNACGALPLHLLVTPPPREPSPNALREPVPPDAQETGSVPGPGPAIVVFAVLALVAVVRSRRNGDT